VTHDVRGGRVGGEDSPIVSGRRDCGSGRPSVSRHICAPVGACLRVRGAQIGCQGPHAGGGCVVYCVFHLEVSGRWWGSCGSLYGGCRVSE
jgi:hypothetical protein